MTVLWSHSSFVSQSISLRIFHYFMERERERERERDREREREREVSGLYYSMGAINGCYTAPLNVIKFKINYSHFFKDIEKVGYVLNVCQFK